MKTCLIVQGSALVAEDIRVVVQEIFPDTETVIRRDFTQARDWISRTVSLDLAVIPARPALLADRKLMSAFALYRTQLVLITDGGINPLDGHLPGAAVLQSPFTDAMLHATLGTLRLSDA